MRLTKLTETWSRSRIEGLSEWQYNYPLSIAYRWRNWTLSVGTIFVALYQTMPAASNRLIIKPSIIKIIPRLDRTPWTWANVMQISLSTNTGGSIWLIGGEFVKPLWLIFLCDGAWRHWRVRSYELPCISNLANIIEFALYIISS